MRGGRFSDFRRGSDAEGISNEGVACDAAGFAALEENLTSAPSCSSAIADLL